VPDGLAKAVNDGCDGHQADPVASILGLEQFTQLSCEEVSLDDGIAKKGDAQVSGSVLALLLELLEEGLKLLQLAGDVDLFRFLREGISGRINLGWGHQGFNGIELLDGKHLAFAGGNQRG